MQWKDIVELAIHWPEVSEAVSYGEPSLKVRNRLLARHRMADDSVVLMDVPGEERDHLIEIVSHAFFIEPHYEGHDIILARLSHLPPDVATRLLERRWRASATKRAISTYDEAHTST